MPEKKTAKKAPKKAAKKSAEKVTEKASNEKQSFEPDLSYLPGWSKRIGKPVEELQAIIEERVEDLRVKHPQWLEKKLWDTSRRRTYADFKAEMRSSAVPWIGKVIYDGDAFDYGNRDYLAALALWKAHPDEARNKGLVREIKKGAKVVGAVPIDPNPTFKNSDKPNPNFGKDLPEHNWVKTICVACMPLAAYEQGDYEQIRPGFISVFRALADPEHANYVDATDVIGYIVKFKGTNKTDKENEESWEINATTVTKFTPVYAEDENGEKFPLTYLGDLEDDDGNIVRQILHDDEIPEIFTDYFCELGDLEEYHASFMEVKKDGTREQSNRLVITEGEVVDIGFADEEGQNNRIVIDDESLGFGDEFDDEGQAKITESITCWVSPKVPIDFGKYSRIRIYGSTSRTLRKDMITQEYTEEWNTVSVNVKGIAVIEYVEPDELEDETPQDTTTKAASTIEPGETPNIEEPSEEQSKDKW